MPELPEVETVRRGIAPSMCGRTITRVQVHERRLRWPVPPQFSRRLAGQKIIAVDRRAKYLVVTLENDDRFLLHLGMSGRLGLVPQGTRRQKHDHLDIALDSGTVLRFNDPRRFGAALLWPRGVAEHPLLKHLGPEPLDLGFDGDYLFALSRSRRVALKNFLMDQRVVVGVGNIYASESLFHAGVRPQRAAGRVTRAQFQRIAASIRKVLQAAINQGGTTLKDARFTAADGSFGYFQVKLAVYDRSGLPCAQCGTPIRRLLLGQRSSFYCPRCQS